MQNIHTHARDQSLHITEATAREAGLSRGYPLDLTVRFDAFMRDAEPFEKVIVFGLKARRTGHWVPDDYIADFVARAPQKLVGFASCDPTQPGHMDEPAHGVEDRGPRGVKMGPAYAGFDPRDDRCAPVYDYCQAACIPIIFYTGTTFNRAAALEFSRPWLFDEVATHYPELRMVLAHLGHPCYDECLAVIRKHPHLYADVAALYYRPWQFYNMMVLSQEYQVTHKLLFGTDYPFAGGRGSVEGVRNVNRVIGGSPLPAVPAEAINAILERDAFGLLGLS